MQPGGTQALITGEAVKLGEHEVFITKRSTYSPPSQLHEVVDRWNLGKN